MCKGFEPRVEPTIFAEESAQKEPTDAHRHLPLRSLTEGYCPVLVVLTPRSCDQVSDTE